MASLYEQFVLAVSQHPDRIALVDADGHETTFAELLHMSQGFAAKWRSHGIDQGDRVLLAMGISTSLYASLAALWSLGATVVLPEPAMGLKGLQHATRATQPKAYCATGSFSLLKYALPELWAVPIIRPTHLNTPRVLDHAPERSVSPEDVALISFTSGTSGYPKGIPRSHAFLMAQYSAVSSLLSSEAQERDLVTFPVFVLVNLAQGRTSVLPSWKMSKLDTVSPKMMSDWILKQGVTRALIPPSLCEVLLASDAPDCLHTVFTGGGPVFPNIISRLSDDAGLAVHCVYGSTEAEPITHLDAKEISKKDRDDMAEGRGLLVGAPVPQVTVRFDGAEILVAGDHVNDGYLDPTQNAENKVLEAGTVWHRTGDAGHLDAEGRLWLLGRKESEVSTRSGVIYPFSVEVAARDWPGVRQCALVSQNDQPLLVIEGDISHLLSWQDHASKLGIANVTSIGKIPMDARHASKVDRVRLAKML